jgi:hypothetical protein
VLESEAASIKIRVKPAEGVYEGVAAVPTVPSRNMDFSAANFQVFDFAAGFPMPGNIVPASRTPPEYRMALSSLPMPNVASAQGSVNAAVQFSGAIPSAGRLVLNAAMVPVGLTTAAWLPLAKDAPKTYPTTLRLLVAGQEVARKDVAMPVRQ